MLEVLFKDRLFLNLVWINRHADPAARFIFRDSEQEAIKNCARNWLRLNATSAWQVTFWYFGPTCSRAQVERTRAFFADAPEIKLRDVADLMEPTTRAIFASSSVPIYWKVDIARFIIAHHQLDAPRPSVCCYSDLDLGPIDISAALVRNRHKDLSRLMFYGALYCASRNTQSGCENGFFLLSNTNREMCAAVHNIMVVVPINFMRTLMLSGLESEEFQEHVDVYLLNQWGFSFNNLALLVQAALAQPKNILCMLTGRVFGLQSDPMPIDEYLKLVREHPYLVLESRVLTKFIETEEEPREKIPVFAQSYLSFSPVNCDDSTNALDEKIYKQQSELQKGAGHTKHMAETATRLAASLARARPDVFFIDEERTEFVRKHARNTRFERAKAGCCYSIVKKRRR